MLSRPLKSLHELEAQAKILAALSAAYLWHEDCGKSQTALGQPWQVTREIGDPGIIAITDGRIGMRLLTAGRHREAQGCFERTLEAPLLPREQQTALWNYLHARTMARALLARALWLQGFPDRAHREARISVEEEQTTDHPLSIVVL